MKPVRVVVLSAVRHAREYLPILTRLGAQVVAVAEQECAPAWMHDEARAVAALCASPVMSVAQALALAGEADLALVCSEPTRHAQLALAALQAGLPVLVDKPVATSASAGYELAQVAAAQGLWCAVINRLETDSVRRARRWVDDGRLGLVRHVDVEFFASGADFAQTVERPELVTDVALSGGGEMMNFAGYAIDAVRYLTGLPVVSVAAFASTLFGEAHRQAGVEDAAVLSLELDPGVTATVTVARVAYAPSANPAAMSIRLIGSHGHGEVSDDVPALLAFGAANAELVAPSSALVTIERILTDVLAAVRGGKAPSYDATFAAQTVEVIEAAYASVASGQVVTVGSGPTAQ